MNQPHTTFHVLDDVPSTPPDDASLARLRQYGSLAEIADVGDEGRRSQHLFVRKVLGWVIAFALVAGFPLVATAIADPLPRSAVPAETAGLSWPDLSLAQLAVGACVLWLAGLGRYLVNRRAQGAGAHGDVTI